MGPLLDLIRIVGMTSTAGLSLLSGLLKQQFGFIFGLSLTSGSKLHFLTEFWNESRGFSGWVGVLIAITKPRRPQVLIRPLTSPRLLSSFESESSFREFSYLLLTRSHSVSTSALLFANHCSGCCHSHLETQGRRHQYPGSC